MISSGRQRRLGRPVRRLGPRRPAPPPTRSPRSPARRPSARPSDGLILRDTIYAATGVPVPSLLDDRTGRVDLVGPRHPDRAGLGGGHRDRSTIRSCGPDPPLRWDWGPTGRPGRELDLAHDVLPHADQPGAAARATGTSECAPGQPAAASTDLVQCTGQLRTVTAALLTARFPYVTPSGVVDCPGPGRHPAQRRRRRDAGRGRRVRREHRRRHAARPDAADPRRRPAPQQLRARRRPARRHLPRRARRRTRSWCRSSSTSTTAPVRTWSAEPRGVTLEALVPPITILQAKGALYSARAQLERAHAMLATDQLWSASTELGAAAAPAVDEWRGNQVAVVYQATRPGIAAPLGWVLSEGSIDAMDAGPVQAGPGRGPGVRRRPRPDVSSRRRSRGGGRGRPTDPVRHHRRRARPAAGGSGGCLS